jgi:hypothetical protein
MFEEILFVALGFAPTLAALHAADRVADRRILKLHAQAK